MVASYPLASNEVEKVECSNCGKTHYVHIAIGDLRADGSNHEITICNCGQSFQLGISEGKLWMVSLDLDQARKNGEEHFRHHQN